MHKNDRPRGIQIRPIALGAFMIATCAITPWGWAALGVNPTASHPELYAFDTFLDGNNDVAAALVSVPVLAKSDAFLVRHPELARLFQEYPNLQQELVERPDVLRNREQRYRAANASGVRVTRTAMDWLDKYLAATPELERTLRSRPTAIEDPEILAKYVPLKKGLDENPGLAEAFKNRPAVFLARPDFFAHKPGERKTS